MAYFAMVVANPALAKSGGSAWWSQGFIYLRNFVMPYGLWIPFLLVLPFAVPRLSKWWTAGDRIGLVVLLTPLLAGMVDVLYVVHLGGDYMHARLLLPAFLSICVGLYVDIRQCRSVLAVFVVGIAMWAVVCASQLRWSVPDVVVFGFRGIGTYHGITNERSYSTLVSGKSHPITLADYGNRPLDDEYRVAAELAQRKGRHLMLVVNNPFKPFAVADIRNARPILPSRFAVNATTIGVNGVESGPQVYIYDSLSLANPIGSHTKLSVRGRPGHEKAIGTAWMIARFAPAGEQFPAGSPSITSVNAARRALSCNPLHSYLNAITAPLSFSLMWSNIVHSIGYTTMSYSPTPDIAARQLCG
jgi:arabinofuranosyltransferase